MSSYIELDKQGSFPPSSNSGKVIFGVDNSGNATITNVSGTTTPIGGGGTGLYIPKPIVYASGGVGITQTHGFNENISNLGDGSGAPGAIQNSWVKEGLRLTYDTSDDTFLNYNPKYFLFVYNTSKTQTKAYTTHPNNRLNSKYGKYFVHPASYKGGTNISTYKNFSGSLFNITAFDPLFTDFTTEWDVTPSKGKSTLLNGFNPLRFYYSTVSGGYIGKEFFPIKVTGATNDPFVRVTTVKAYRRSYIVPKTTPVVTYVKPKLDLYIKFAIVINDPNNPGRYLIGPMSDTIKIFPKSGYFYDNINDNQTYKYFYTWSWKFI